MTAKIIQLGLLPRATVERKAVSAHCDIVRGLQDNLKELEGMQRQYRFMMQETQEQYDRCTEMIDNNLRTLELLNGGDVSCA